MVEVLISERGRNTSAWCAIEKSDLDQVRFDNLLDRVLFFVNRGRDRSETNWAATELFDDRQQKFAIHFVQAVCVDFHSIQCIGSHFFRDVTFVINFGVIANASQQSIHYSRSAA